MSLSLIPILSPHGVLRFEPRETEAPLEETAATRLKAHFDCGIGHGLLQLGLGEVGTALPPALAFWRSFAMRFIIALCAHNERANIPPPLETFADMIYAAPPMQGGEYLQVEVLREYWNAMQQALQIEHEASGLSLQKFMSARDRRWRLVGRVHLNLAENRRDEDFPFAFMATYVASLSEHGVMRHAPLARAQVDFAGDNKKLLDLLEPVSYAASQLDWLQKIVDCGEIFHPLRWSVSDAVRFLRDAEIMKQAGLIVRTPSNWRMSQPGRPRVEAKIGSTAPSMMGVDAMLDFDYRVCLDGETLSLREVQSLLKATEGLAFLRGKWVEVDSERLKATIDHFKKAQSLARKEGMPFAQAMRLFAGADLTAEAPAAVDAKWALVEAGDWLAKTLEGCRNPQALAAIDLGAALKAELRPYQKAGVGWLNLLTQLRLGACLADDMGLGKTIQTLALLLMLKQREPAGGPSLLVAPASLLANWGAEAERFAPDLRIATAHPAFIPAAELKNSTPEYFNSFDLVVTSYSSLLRIDSLAKTRWRLVMLDEAQAIKNPHSKQTRAVKALQGESRIALTGTPIENNLGDLWSIFDFINPGLMGSSKAFSGFVKKLSKQEPISYAPLRKLAAPYILRRLKTDKSIIADLPDKTEVKAYCSLSKKQAALYQDAVFELETTLRQVDNNIARRGLVLAMLIRLKQICNHPAQWLGDNAYDAEHSGKFMRLAEIAETIASRQEKLLVFTQFKEIIPPLEHWLANAFSRPGLTLHGATAVSKRKALVKKFQEDESVPFFILSLKAGGVGLNLTAASHVVHFDRWWNPAVENQATDRAFRIGQKRNVLVHKFVSRGTIEERIDALIASKQELAQDVLAGGQEVNLTELSDKDLLDFVKLDLSAAMKEA